MSTLSVEATGETVGEAKWNALRDLERLAPGLDSGSVHFQVVSEGERGLLGVGFAPARVIATVAASAASEVVSRGSDESVAETHARELVERVVGAMGIRVRVQVRENAGELLVTCSGDDLGLLIGKHGQTIDALQTVANAALHRAGTLKPVTVDAAGYRERRRTTLASLALRSAERAALGERVLLEPMTPGERKIVHERLQEFPGVQTASEGTEPHRYVVVFPA
ncbi:MAG TPA: RNA-binding cell elongation regulator Jag/EloR [Gaiellaceae bacterium]|nr:RNA-binding cell elongation regulator Jag/EloR [Gaiellaceae bacterium]